VIAHPIERSKSTITALGDALVASVIRQPRVERASCCRTELPKLHSRDFKREPKARCDSSRPKGPGCQKHATNF
jgi:hypothetical protein